MKLYNIDGCGYCAMVRNVLAQTGIDYEKIDVSFISGGLYTAYLITDSKIIKENIIIQ